MSSFESLTPSEQTQVLQVVDLLGKSKSILFITGAGLSADSGLPTYRGVGGLYEGKAAEMDLPIEAMLSGRMFSIRPELTWKYLTEIEKACRGVNPNRGHEVIAEIENSFERVWVLTQNVDGFHRRAGSKKVIEMHGMLSQIHCTKCPHKQEVETYEGFSLPPKCPDCNGILRPKVVLFGEALPKDQLSIYNAETSKGFDLVFSIGTTSVFPYISAPVLDAHHLKKPSIEINPGETDVSEFVTVKLALGAAKALDAIWTEYQKRKA